MGGTRNQDREEYREFAEARAARLFRIAYLMCGNWHEAEDLTQDTLTKLYVAWPKVRRAGNPDAYAHRTLMNAFLAHRRRKSAGELPVAEFRDAVVHEEDSALRLSLLRALRQLPPKGRAVVVLRYLEDHSVETVASVLGMSPSAVTTAGMRALAQLREILGAGREHLFRS